MRCEILLAIGLLWPAALSAAEKQPWKILLPTKDLNEHFRTKGNWMLSNDDAAHLIPRPGEKGWTRYDAYLWVQGNYTNFEIEFEYKLDKGGNSGFYFHVGDTNNPVATGIEVQICDITGKKPGAKLTDHDSGGIIPSIPPTKAAAKPAGEWNKFHITCQGNLLVVKLNGEVVNEVDLQHDKLKGRPKSGAIGFQDHGLPLSLRNIRVRELAN